jgi:hypothetical protein
MSSSFGSRILFSPAVQKEIFVAVDALEEEARSRFNFSSNGHARSRSRIEWAD